MLLESRPALALFHCFEDASLSGFQGNVSGMFTVMFTVMFTPTRLLEPDSSSTLCRTFFEF